MEKIAARKPAGMVLAALGALLLMIAIVSGGASVIAPGTAESRGELEALSANGGGLYRPFVKCTFGTATYSGLYLSDDQGVPQVWVMWGFRDDCVLCFYLDADGEDRNGDGVFDTNDSPEDIWDVEYVLRAAQASVHESSEWVLGESIGDTAAYYGLTEDEAATLFADGVLEAARSDLATMRVAFWVGVVLAAVGAVLLVLPESVSLAPGELVSGVARAIARARGATAGEDVEGTVDEADEKDEENAADEEDEADEENEEDEDVSDR